MPAHAPRPIQQLSPEVAAKIAAGEVVERPASVVKELVENALDAGARSIRLELLNGGLDLIRVSDDGRGIPADELPLAIARHATSKIGAISDLERITTLGFRGEALASIAAVSRLTLISRPHADTLGAQIAVDEGRIAPIAPAGAPAGTSVTVRGLFASVPARVKFLKTRSTETAHCLRLLEQYALAWPETRFTALSEGRQIFHTSGDSSLYNAMIAVYGLSVAEQMIPLEGADEDDAPAPDVAHTASEYSERPQVGGYVSRPTCYKSSRQYLSFFVNRRWAQSRTLSYAVEEAYHSLLLTGRHPLAVVNIALDPALLDVNVHPAKTEVKFLRERQVYAAVQRATRAALLAATTAMPAVSRSVFSVPAWEDTDDAGASDDADMDGAPSPSTASSLLTQDVAQDALWRGQSSATSGERRSGFAVPGAAPDAPVGGKRLPALRVLGQVSQSYIITEGPDGVYMVDQHAAHERILLERMVAEWRSRTVSSQLLLEPLPLELAPAEREALDDSLDRLRAIGFEIEPFGEEALLVRAVPASLSKELRAQSLRELLLALAGADAEAASHGETWEEHALANVACKAAIKAGQSLSPQEQRELIAQLEACQAGQSCCHGRPTMVHMSLSALEREFDRR